MSTVQKWGNSLAIRIPRETARRLDIDVGTEVEISVSGSASASGSDHRAVLVRPRVAATTIAP